MDRDPVPWYYGDIARRYLTLSSDVLDIGTGGGEVFLGLAEHFGWGVGIDRKPQMIRTAFENRDASPTDKVTFCVMKAEALAFPDATFDVVLNRHAPIFRDEVVRVVRPGGYFLTQQVGGRNAQSIFDAFGWGSNEQHWLRFFAQSRGEDFRELQVQGLLRSLPAAGCEIIEHGEYDVRTYFQNEESLIFYLLWSSLPEKLDPDRHHRQVTRLLEEHRTPRGIESNEHREFLVARRTPSKHRAPRVLPRPHTYPAEETCTILLNILAFRAWQARIHPDRVPESAGSQWEVSDG